jgi:hypothetical protein
MKYLKYLCLAICLFNLIGAKKLQRNKHKNILFPHSSFSPMVVKRLGFPAGSPIALPSAVMHPAPHIRLSVSVGGIQEEIHEALPFTKQISHYYPDVVECNLNGIIEEHKQVYGLFDYDNSKTKYVSNEMCWNIDECSVYQCYTITPVHPVHPVTIENTCCVSNVRHPPNDPNYIFYKFQRPVYAHPIQQAVIHHPIGPTVVMNPMPQSHYGHHTFAIRKIGGR